MSVAALGTRPAQAGAPATPAAATPAVGAAQDTGDNLFAALLAGLGDAMGAAAADDSAAAGGAAATDAALTGEAASAAGAAPTAALPAATPDPLAGMALLMAQYAPGSTPAPSQALTVAGGGGAALAAGPAGTAGTASTAAASSATVALAGRGENLPGPGAADPLGILPATADARAATAGDNAQALQAAQPAWTTPATASDVPAVLQAVPDMSAMAAGWAVPAAPAAPSGAPATAPVYQAELPSRPGEAAFAGDLAAQVTVLVEGGFQQAELRLNPAELGPIQIQLSVSSQTQTADISFTAVHGLTRDSIEQSLPALRDMLEAQGLSLGQAGVSGGAPHQGDGRGNAAGQARQNRAGVQTTSDDGLAGTVAPRTAGMARATRGMLDLYA